MRNSETGSDRALPETQTKLVGEDWCLDDLSGRSWEHVELVRLDLAETTSTAGAAFEGCVFRDVGFDLADHTAAAFVNCVFVDCRFTGARFTECKFVGSQFERCEFARLTVERGDWSFSGLRGADLRRASFADVRLRECDLTGANLTGAVVTGCDLAAASLHNAQFERCDLRRSDLSAVDPWNAGLRGAKITWEQAVVLAFGMGLDVQPE